MVEDISLPLKWDSWTITEQIGSGSYGEVYKACQKNPEEKRYCAIKIIAVDINEHNQKYIDQFQDKMALRDYYFDIVMNLMVEVRTLKLLRGNKNIVEIYDSVVEERKDASGWDIYIMMEFLEDISNAFFSTRNNDERDVIHLGIDICSALEKCEERNILHRDIKPANIMLSAQGNYKLVDFGVARHIEGTKSSLSIQGTYDYMAPEVVQMKQYGNRADLYSLGLVLYKLMNKNKEPFMDVNKKLPVYKDLADSLERRLKGEVLPDPCDASPGFSEIILKACEYNPAERYKSASELKKDLIRLRDGKYRLKKRKNKGGLAFIIPKYYAKLAAKVIAACICLIIGGKAGLYYYNSCHYQLGDKDSDIRIDKNGVMTIDGDETELDEDYSKYNIKKLVMNGDNINIAYTTFPYTLEKIEGIEKLSSENIVYNTMLSGTKYKKNHTENGAFVLNGILISYEGDEKEININEISPNITSIGDNAFSDCASLENIKGLENVTSIEDYAFSDCTSLKNVEDFNNVKSIGEGAFFGCVSLESIDSLDHVTSIGISAFEECTSLVSINGLDHVTSIGESAFSDCISLKSISSLDHVTSINESTFSNCTSLESIDGLNNITSIKSFAFLNCTSLKSIEGLQNVKSIGDCTFEGCTSLENIDGLDHVTSIGVTAFRNTLFGKNHTKNGMFILNGILLFYEGDEKKLNIKDISSDITSIGNSAFSGCASLESIKGLENVTSIGDYAFSDCTSLQSIDGLDKVTSIGEGAFSDCTKLTHINGLTYSKLKHIKVGDGAFDNCTSLKLDD